MLLVLTPLWQVSSYSCYSAFVIKPSFQVLTTALGGWVGVTLGAEMSHIPSHLRGESLVLKSGRKSVTV